MTEIVLIRHGETSWNFAARLQGHLDIPLNARGVEQARRLAQALGDEVFDAVIASDLQRAFDTAQAIAAPRAMRVLVDSNLRERCFGAFEGLLYADIESHFPQAWQDWKTRAIDARYPAGVRVAETLREFSARSLDSVFGHARAHPGKKIAIVTHGGVLDCVYRAAAQIALDRPRDFDIMNTGVNRFVLEGDRVTLVRWGDISHLAQPSLDELA